MDVRAVRNELSQWFTTNGYAAYDVVPGDIDTPSVVIGPPRTVTYNMTVGGKVAANFIIKFYESTGDGAGAQRELDEAMSYPGFVDLLQTYKATAWRSLRVNTAGNVHPETWGDGRTLLAAEFDIDIFK